MHSLLTRLRVWANTFFDELWRLIPAQPILFPFFFVGGVITLIWYPGANLLRWENGATATYCMELWKFLAVISPLMVLLAWWMIIYRCGRTRYAGLLIRLGGDIGQLFVLATYLLARFIDPTLGLRDDRIYGLSVILGSWVFVLILVARDLYALWFVEQLASKLRLGLNEDRRDARR
jgi:hypothetical protein